MSINPGDDVLIASGPFAGRRAVVVDVRDDVAQVMVIVFDRAVLLDVAIDDLQPRGNAGGDRAT